MWMRGFFCLALPLLARQAAAGAPAQRPEAQAPVFRTEAALALVRFHVVRKHTYVDDLKPEDIILLEDGLPRKVKVFEGGRLAPRTIPIEMTLLFDTSGSVTGAGLLDPLAYKATLLDNLESVRLAVYTFTFTLRRHCRPTRDPAELAAAEPGQATRMLVVFSDGFPTTNTPPEDAVAVLSELGIPVYPVVLGHASIAALQRLPRTGTPLGTTRLFFASSATIGVWMEAWLRPGSAR